MQATQETKQETKQEGLPYNCIRCHQTTYLKSGDPARCKNETCKFRILMKEPRQPRVYLAR
jgi:DNA-directed RNA polymerase subunit RPC12/RpoP